MVSKAGVLASMAGVLASMAGVLASMAGVLVSMAGVLVSKAGVLVSINFVACRSVSKVSKANDIAIQKFKSSIDLCRITI
jgi:hypothetical protein